MNTNDFMTKIFYNKLIPLLAADINNICSAALKNMENINEYNGDTYNYMYSKLSQHETVDKLIKLAKNSTHKINEQTKTEIMDTIYNHLETEDNKTFMKLLTRFIRADNNFLCMESHYYYQYDAYDVEPNKELIIERTLYDIIFEYVGNVFIPMMEEFGIK